jgi:WD40 repeat protein
MVRAWVVDARHEIFLDRDPEAGIAPGDEWEKRLYERLRWAEVVVCVVTSAYARSPWCAAEVALAVANGARIIPVVAERDARHSLLTRVQYLDATNNPTETKERLVAALNGVGGRGRSLPDGVSPFPGLRPFDADRRRVFFGRESDVQRLSAVLRSAERAGGAVQLLVGPSGCGKSSLVRAGLLPAMADEADYFTLAPCAPGPDPVSAIVRELAAAARDLKLTGWSIEQVHQRVATGLTAVVDDLLLAVPGERRSRLLLVVDQFEELLTQSSARARHDFARLVGPALTGPLQVVATLRPEFLAALLSSPELAGLTKRVHTVEPIRPSSLAAVIERPAALAGITLEDGLVDRLVADTGTGDALPLLAYMLAELTKDVPRGGRLSLERYAQLGGVQGALRAQADAALIDAVAAGRRDSAAVVRELLQLVVIDDLGRLTRWPAVREELSPTATAELDEFINRHLLVTERRPTSDETAVSIAHEAFLTEWPPLAAAIDRESNALRARSRIEQAAADWTAHDGGTDGLWEGAQLAGVMNDVGADVRRTGLGRGRALTVERVELSPKARSFLLTSELRDRRRRRRGIAIVSVLLFIASVGGLLALWQWQQVAQQKRGAVALQLLAQADATRATGARDALLLALAADRIDPGASARANLVETITHTAYARTLPTDTDVLSLAYAPDGRTLVTGDADGRATVWDLADPGSPRRLGAPLAAQSTYLYDLAFAPGDQRVLAAAGADGTITLWDLRDPAAPRPLGPPLQNDGAAIVHGVAFSHDGRTLAAVDFAERLMMYDVADPAAPRLLGIQPTGHRGYVTKVSFSADDQVLATAGYDTTVRLWSLADRARPASVGAPLGSLTSAVWTVAFAPTGRLLVAVGADGFLARWDVGNPAGARALGTPLRAHTGSAYAVAFSPEGSTVATVGADRAVVLWSLADPSRPTRMDVSMYAHSDQVYAVAFAPDRQVLVSAGADRTAVLWDLAGTMRPAPVGRPLAAKGGTVVAMTVSADGHTLACGPVRGGTELWDLRDPAQPRLRTVLPGAEDVQSLAFAPTGSTLVAGTVDGSLVAWDVPAGGPPRLLGKAKATAGPVNALSYSTDGRLIAVAGQDGTISVWRADAAGVVRIGDAARVHTGAAYAVAFAPDGKTLVSGGAEGAVLRWTVADDRGPQWVQPALTGGGAAVIAVAFTPDGRTLVTGGDEGSVLVWRVPQDGRPQRSGAPLAGDGGRVYTLRFSTDGATLAAGGARGLVALWDFSDPAVPRPLGRPSPAGVGPVTSVAFGATESWMAVSGASGGTAFWDLSALQDLRGHAVERACAITGRGMDRTEWAARVAGLDYEASCPQAHPR